MHTKMPLVVTFLCTGCSGRLDGLGFGDDVPGVQPAFFLRGFFPPPTAFALVLVRQYRAGAGLTADADEAAFMQAVVRQFKHADVTPDFFTGHLRQGVEPVSYTHLTLPTKA